MANELIYKKEVTYEFNYNGDAYIEDHYVDNQINQRFRFYNNTLENTSSTPLNVKGTGAAYAVISAVLVGERILFEDAYGQKTAELMYFLPDVNCHALIKYRKESELGNWNTSWAFPSDVSLITF